MSSIVYRYLFPMKSPKIHLIKSDSKRNFPFSADNKRLIAFRRCCERLNYQRIITIIKIFMENF